MRNGINDEEKSSRLRSWFGNDVEEVIRGISKWQSVHPCLQDHFIMMP